MQVHKSVIDIALSLVTKSLAESTPKSIDECISENRIIVEFTCFNEEVTLITAEILDSDWELLPSISIEFQQMVSQLVEYRNIQYRKLLMQEKQIREDRTYY